MRSPAILSDKMNSASRTPQTLPRHRPIAADPHATPTIVMMTNDQFPSDRNASWASGFKRHSKSDAVLGNRSSTMVSMHIVVPKAKKTANHRCRRDCFTPNESVTFDKPHPFRVGADETRPRIIREEADEFEHVLISVSKINLRRWHPTDHRRFVRFVAAKS